MLDVKMLQLVGIVQEQAAATRQLLEQIELRKSPSKYYSRFLHFLMSLCDRINREVEETSKSADVIGANQAVIQEAAEAFVVLCGSVLREIHYYCESFDHAELEEIPVPMMLLLDRLGKRIGQAKPFMLRGMPLFSYMYNPVGENLNRLAAQISETMETIDSSFAIFSYPLANSRNVLCNCSLIHEFGHLVVDSGNLIDSVLRRVEASSHDKREKIRETIDKHARSGALDLNLFELADRVNKANEVLRNWIHECLADLIGLYLIGPAHLFNFIHWIRPMGAHQTDDLEHPCNAFRVRLMVEASNRLGWQDLVKKETQATLELAERISQLKRRENQGYQYDAAAECLPILEQYMFEEASNICKAAMYKPDHFTPCKDHMMDLLRRGIPPVETLDENAAKFCQYDAVSILNAGWLFYEKGFPSWDQQFMSLDLVQRGEFLNRLLNKALEISFIKEEEANLARGSA